MTKILALHTGGTISMHADAKGHVVAGTNNPIAQITSDLPDIQLDNREVFQLPSPHIQPKHMLQIFHEIKKRADDYDGIVITHGTDTLEETAYFLDTMALPDIPVVLTGAMRSSNELGSDGVYNFICAIRVCAHPKTRDKGVLVVMNDEVHAAKYVTKTHTTNVSTFQTPTHGPLGLVTKHDVLYFKTAEPREHFDLHQISGVVPIIKAYAGMSDEILRMIVPDSIDGLVIEALGAGNLPPAASERIGELISKGVPVVLVSRCFNGIAEPVYAYEGGGVNLAEMGVMFVKELNAPKARLKLLIAISVGLSGAELKRYIED